jgi:hypothetical protein
VVVLEDDSVFVSPFFVIVFVLFLVVFLVVFFSVFIGFSGAGAAGARGQAGNRRRLSHGAIAQLGVRSPGTNPHVVSTGTTNRR